MSQQRSTKDDFTFGAKLGSGSYGIVWLAVRKWDNKSYAVKEIDLADLGRKEQEECIREVQVLAALDCPYIIKYYDSFLDKGRLYIVMEYAVGGNLHSLVNKHKGDLPEDLIWKLFLQIVLSLRHMHSKKILHRDLKSLNVFLDEENNAKVGDFGVAKVLSTQTNFARTIVGTPYYLSPELCEDKPYNEKSDMWAAGVVLYEMCTRRHPFDAENQGALILKILRGKFPPVTGYSAELQDIVKRCLTQAAQKRPSADRIIALPAVQEKAQALGITLPEVRIKPEKSLASASSGIERTGSSGMGTSSSTKKGSSLKSTGPKKSKTVKRSTGKKESTLSKSSAGRSRPDSGGTITVSGDMDGHRPSPGTSREQAHRDIAFVFGEKDDDKLERAGSEVSVGVSELEINEGGHCEGDGRSDADAPTWRVVGGEDTLQLGAGKVTKGEGGKSAWTSQQVGAGGSEEEEEEEDSEDELGGAEGGAGGAVRAEKLSSAVEQTKRSIEEMVGAEAMAKLYELLKQRSDGEAMSADNNIADLSRVVFKIIPYDKAEVLSLVYKLLYLEGQLVDPGAKE